MIAGAEALAGRLAAYAGGCLFAGIILRAVAGASAQLSPSIMVGLLALLGLVVLAGALVLLSRIIVQRPPAGPRPRPMARPRARLVEHIESDPTAWVGTRQSARTDDELGILGEGDVRQR